MRSVSLALFIAITAAAPAMAGPDRQLGLSVQANVAAMVVDLNPAYANTRMEGTSGQLGEAAATRYRNGQVKPLIPLSGKSELGIAAATGSAPQSRGSDGTGAARTGGPN